MTKLSCGRKGRRRKKIQRLELICYLNSNSKISFVCLFVLPSCMHWGILVPSPGIELLLSAVEALSPNHWTARKSPKWFFFKSSFHHHFLINPKNMTSRGNLWLFLWFTRRILNSSKVSIKTFINACHIKHFDKYSNILINFISLISLWIRIKCLGRDEKNIWLNENWQRTKTFENNYLGE